MTGGESGLDVYFGENFWHKPGKGADRGICIEASAEFWYGTFFWCVPAIYVCREGIVLDILRRIPKDKIRKFLDKWGMWQEREEELTGKGVSYCATCDGAFYRGKDVAVVGGGNTALEDATFLSGYCRRVYAIHRRAEFRGEARLLEALKKKENVDFLLNCQVIALEGEERLSAVVVRQTDTEETSRLEVDGLFIAVGQAPDNQAFADQAALDAYGYIEAGEDCRTKTPGVFAAGDCRAKGVRQLTTAAADGAVAALAACAYLTERSA